MIRGMFCLISGLHALFVEPRLRSVVWRILLFLALLMGLVAAGSFWLSMNLSERFIPTGDAWYVDILAGIIWLFSLLLAMAAGVVVYVTLGSIAAAPWLEELAARAERGHDSIPGSWWKTMLSSLWNTMMPLLGFAPYAVLALLLLLLPVYGTVLSAIVWAWGGIKLLSYEFLDVPAGRRGWKWPKRKREIEEHKWFYLGFSGLASLLLLVPVMNLFVLPAAVVGLSRHLPSASASSTDENMLAKTHLVE